MIFTPEAMADHFTGELVPVIWNVPPAVMIGMIWMESYEKWSIGYLTSKIEQMLKVRNIESYKTISRCKTTAGRPYVLVVTE